MVVFFKRGDNNHGLKRPQEVSSSVELVFPSTFKKALVSSKWEIREHL